MEVGGEEWVVRKPSRSDEVLEAEEQLRIASKIRDHLDSMAPKRPIKPNRSESDSSSSSAVVSSQETENVPEFHKFLSLNSQQSNPIISGEGSPSVQEEFVETHYYKELISIDKQHHTTGNGFIRVGESFEDGYGLQLDRGSDHVRAGVTTAFRSNPATNDWIPGTEVAGETNFVSSKPSRSESSLDG
ncbi:uncharacterized protein LOC122662318 [Telopea speciosissima]|uniref:uncharacterized protein LOC122662318 n=1 Tax=Telopea speciosissima TaxID=54955 RepID=UPI001CC33564|nr:uncharacterized protein LOC122662318 [Telopea speciosissima]